MLTYLQEFGIFSHLRVFLPLLKHFVFTNNTGLITKTEKLSLCVSVVKQQHVRRKDRGGLRHSPFSKVCFPPDKTPTGRVPVGVRPFSVNTLSLSSLISSKYTHRKRITFNKEERRHLMI